VQSRQNSLIRPLQRILWHGILPRCSGLELRIRACWTIARPTGEGNEQPRQTSSRGKKLSRLSRGLPMVRKKGREYAEQHRNYS
jgi:hypothetical protein